MFFVSHRKGRTMRRCKETYISAAVISEISKDSKKMRQAKSAIELCSLPLVHHHLNAEPRILGRSPCNPQS